MKRTLLVFLFLGFSHLGFGQTGSGNWLVGGNGRFYQSRASGIGKNAIEVDLNVGYFIFNNFSVGIMGGYGFVQGLEEKYNGQLFLRYYVPITEMIAPYAQANGGYRLRINQGINNNEVKFYGPMAGGRIGTAFFLSRHVSFDAFFYLDYTSETNRFADGIESEPIATYDYGLGIGFQIFLGKD
ncbi:MAG: hypothetical protein LPK80_07505 [Bacteroidota bacterium]|nr:hypothetical protein [Bacteroidota bacterium]MDX5448695.1 hypothetical protein [Bacteroidota bacterium]